MTFNLLPLKISKSVDNEFLTLLGLEKEQFFIVFIIFLKRTMKL